LNQSILLVSYYAPSKGHAGGLRLLNLYSEIRKIRPDLHLALLTFEHEFEDCGGECLDHIFNEVHRLPLDKFDSSSISSVVFIHAKFDFIDLQYHQCGRLIGACRKRWSKAVIAYSPMESMVRGRQIMQIKGWGARRFREMAAASWFALQEKLYVLAADRVITVSVPDHDVLAPFKTTGSVFCVPTGVSVDELPEEEFKLGLNGEAIVVFFAYFGSKTNCEGLLWYCKRVHPLIKKQVANYRFRVVGRGLPEELRERCVDEKIEFVGPVDCIEDGLNGATIGIAPALSGAGVRGKIHQYAMMGIPSVASPLACEGLDYRDGESILIADDPKAFAAACVLLLKYKELRDEVGTKARKVSLSRYSWGAMDAEISLAYSL
jgi:glycosyltransferase involved in cell wall biosynthesis